MARHNITTAIHTIEAHGYTIQDIEKKLDVLIVLDDILEDGTKKWTTSGRAWEAIVEDFAASLTAETEAATTETTEVEAVDNDDSDFAFYATIPARTPRRSYRRTTRWVKCLNCEDTAAAGTRCYSTGLTH